MTTSTEEGGDPQTTNLYVGNLGPQVRHRTLTCRSKHSSRCKHGGVICRA